MNKLGNLIGSGGCSEVFEWEDDKIVKVFRSNTTRQAAHGEFQNSVAVWECGLPVPKPYGIVEVEGRPGIVFEKIEGITIIELMLSKLLNNRQQAPNEEAVSDVRMIAELLHHIHSCGVPPILGNQIGIMKATIARASRLTVEERQRVEEYLHHMPVRHALCHGDPNPFNVMIRNGKPIMIDWMGACLGDPAADIAEFILLCRYGVLPSGTPAHIADRLNASRLVLENVFVEVYKTISGMQDEEIEAWLVPIAVCKLTHDNLSDEQYAELTHYIRQKMSIWEINSISGVDHS